MADLVVLPLEELLHFVPRWEAIFLAVLSGLAIGFYTVRNTLAVPVQVARALLIPFLVFWLGQLILRLIETGSPLEIVRVSVPYLIFVSISVWATSKWRNGGPKED